MSNRTLLRAGAFLLSSHVLVATIGIVALRIFTELVPQQALGEANLVLGTLALGVQVVLSHFRVHLLRNQR